MKIEQIRQKYRRNVHGYDLLDRPFHQLRVQAVASLSLSLGSIVLDLGCGTGLSFALLEQYIGEQGRILGVDVSPDMLARARAKILRHAWSNITLIEANAEEVELEPESVDAVLCFYTHDLLTSQQAMERAIQALRPGGRFVAVGAKRATGVGGSMLNLLTLLYSLPYVTNLSDTHQPWVHLEHLLGPLEVKEYFWGSAYLARGVKP